MKERPKCSIKTCQNEAICVMFAQPYCGDCVAKIHYKQREEFRKMMEDIT